MAKLLAMLAIGVALIVALIVARLPSSRSPQWALRICDGYSSDGSDIVYEEHNLKNLPWAPGASASLELHDRAETRRYKRVPECLRVLGFDNVKLRVAPAFLGRLRAVDGTEQTIYVECGIANLCGDPPKITKFDSAYCAQIPTWTDDGGMIGTDGQWVYSPPSALTVFSLMDDPMLGFYFFNRAKVFRLYEGRRDPVDPSEFTALLEADGQRICIRGRLLTANKLRLSCAPEKAATTIKSAGGI